MLSAPCSDLRHADVQQAGMRHGEACERVAGLREHMRALRVRELRDCCMAGVELHWVCWA